MCGRTGNPHSPASRSKKPFRRPVGHRRAERLVIQVDQHHVVAGLTHGLGPLVLVVGVAGEHRVAGRHRAREPGLGQRAVRVRPVPDVDVGAHRGQPRPRESGSRCMSHLRNPRPHRCEARCAATGSPGTAPAAGGSRPAPPPTCSAESASGNGVSARALSDRARTVRNCPDSPVSKPGGVNRNHRGSESRSATIGSTSPVRAQNRRNSHTAVNIALTVEPDRIRPPRPGQISSHRLNRARSGRPIRRQSTPWAWHQPRNSATRPA